jgi:hypothetical protein
MGAASLAGGAAGAERGDVEIGREAPQGRELEGRLGEGRDVAPFVAIGDAKGAAIAVVSWTGGALESMRLEGEIIE